MTDDSRSFRGAQSAALGAAPRLLADVDALLADAGADRRGALWRLAESSRQLDANLIRLPPNASVDAHREPDVDVLFIVVSGNGIVHTETESIALFAHAVAWLPRGSSRSIAAGPDGLAYLTVHRARTGMRIKSTAG